MALKSSLELLLRSGGTGSDTLLKAKCKSLESSVGAISHPMVSSTCRLAVYITGENYCGDSSNLQLAFKIESQPVPPLRSRSSRATTSKPWISFSRCVEPAYQAKNSYLTVHDASYETAIYTRISMAISSAISISADMGRVVTPTVYK